MFKAETPKSQKNTFPVHNTSTKLSKSIIKDFGARNLLVNVQVQEIQSYKHYYLLSAFGLW